MPENGAEIKNAAAPPDPGGTPIIPCLEEEARVHQFVVDHLLPVWRRLSTVDGLRAFEDHAEAVARERGLPTPAFGATPPEEEAESNRQRVEMIELTQELRETLAHDRLSWLICADEAHVRMGDVDSYSTLEDLRDFDVTAYIARHAVAAELPEAESHEPYRVRMAVFAVIMEVLEDFGGHYVLTRQDVLCRLIFGGAYLGGDNDGQGREWLAHARRVSMHVAQGAGTPAERYIGLALATAAEADLCGAMLATELAHASAVATKVGASEDLWPDPFHSKLRYTDGDHLPPFDPAGYFEVFEAKQETGRRLMAAARRVLDPEERAKHAERIREEHQALMAAGEVDHA